jgi:hypothetical protein
MRSTPSKQSGEKITQSKIHHIMGGRPKNLGAVLAMNAGATRSATSGTAISPMRSTLFKPRSFA